MTDPRSFGAWLHRERERRGVALRTIADRTKIGMRLLESLERGDLTRWPGGIYRRAFVRAYAGAVGLDADLVVATLEQLLSADGAPVVRPPGSSRDLESAEPELRLHLAAAPLRLWSV